MIPEALRAWLLSCCPSGTKYLDRASLSQPYLLQTGFDLLMQVLGESFFRQAVDNLVEKSAGN
jgi:hypothetical protein